jgi:restriction endonuclease Mrr
MLNIDWGSLIKSLGTIFIAVLGIVFIPLILFLVIRGVAKLMVNLIEIIKNKHEEKEFLKRHSVDLDKEIEEKNKKLQEINYEIDKVYQELSEIKQERFRLDQELIWMLKGMNPSEFEDYIANLFSHLGYNTKKVGHSHDEGVDVIAEKENSKIYIQCKKFESKKVDVKNIREFYGAIASDLVSGNNKGYFVTTSDFTKEAEKFVENKPIELINSQKLVALIREAEKIEKDKSSINTK